METSQLCRQQHCAGIKSSEEEIRGNKSLNKLVLSRFEQVTFEKGNLKACITFR